MPGSPQNVSFPTLSATSYRRVPGRNSLYWKDWTYPGSPERDPLRQPGYRQNTHRDRVGAWACIQGYKVLFTTVHRLLTQLRESHSLSAH